MNSRDESDRNAQVEALGRLHCTALVTLTDIVGSTALDSSAWCSGEARA